MLPGVRPEAKRILTNIEILDLNYVPKSLAIIGAGAVGVEFASCFHRFGSKVSVFEMLPRIVPVEDEEFSKSSALLQENRHSRRDRREGGYNVQISDEGVRFNVTLDSGKTETVEAEALLVAVGASRIPITSGSTALA